MKPLNPAAVMAAYRLAKLRVLSSSESNARTEFCRTSGPSVSCSISMIVMIACRSSEGVATVRSEIVMPRLLDSSVVKAFAKAVGPVDAC